MLHRHELLAGRAFVPCWKEEAKRPWPPQNRAHVRFNARDMCGREVDGDGQGGS